jgi:hypothetical protein
MGNMMMIMMMMNLQDAVRACKLAGLQVEPSGVVLVLF